MDDASPDPAFEGYGSDSAAETLTYYINTVRRHFPVIILIIACTLAMGLVYLFATPPSFTAKATMVIDTRKVQLFQQQSVLGDIALDPGTVETQVEILKSENISLSVIKEMRLAEDPEFVGPGGGLIGSVVGLVTSVFGSDDVTSEFELTRKALDTFEDRRTIKRLGLTYVMELEFRSLDPAKAANVANGIADAYIVDQLEAKYQATRRASVWLQDRIKELRSQASAAERAVVNFKEQNNIVDTGGRLMNDQQLAEVNSQLILARAAVAEAKARWDRIQDVMKQDIPDASVADALKNDVIIRMRGQYLDLAAREANLSGRYGANHLAVINLRNQMQEIRRNITDEMRKIAQSYKSDYEIAQAREESIGKSVASAVSETQLTNQAQVQMRELESNAQTYRALYDNFLQRYMEAVQQQSFPITEARLISPASRPLRKSHPKTLIVLAVTMAAGLMLSFGFAFMRELSDKVFRTSRQVEERLKVNCIAILAKIKIDNVSSKPKVSTKGAIAPKTMEPRTIVRRDDMLWAVVDQPFARFTESLRSIKVAADLNDAVKTNKVIGITSSLPNEGKSTIAANLAQLIAHSGARAILVDGDLRNPSLTRHLSVESSPGIMDVILNKTTLENVVWSDPATGLTFLPSGATSKLMHTSEIMGSDALKELIDRLRKSYDYVIMDLPPLGPVVDVRMSGNIIDSFVFVVEWGKTSMDMVEHHLAAAPVVYDRILGVVLNKADLKLLGRYESHYGDYYYKKYYARYGYAE